jgi:hypothetical protein
MACVFALGFTTIMPSQPFLAESENDILLGPDGYRTGRTHAAIDRSADHRPHLLDAYVLTSFVPSSALLDVLAPNAVSLVGEPPPLPIEPHGGLARRRQRMPPLVRNPQRGDFQHFTASARTLRRRGGEPFDNDLHHGVDVDPVGEHHCLGAAVRAAVGEKLEHAAGSVWWPLVVIWLTSDRLCSATNLMPKMISA